MTRKIERGFRERRLTPQEIARDAEDRRQVEADYPPAPSGAASGLLSQALRDALRTSGRSTDEISKIAGVSAIVVARFLSGQGDIRMATADKLAETLGLKVVSGS